MSLTSGLDNIAVFSVTRQGVALARRLETVIPARLTVHVPEKYAADAPPHHLRFKDRLQPVVDAAWARHDALIFIGAVGIAVRMIAPHVVDKRHDPGVVVMDIQGRFAVALCSGHLGGANELCQIISRATGAIAVVTTGTDVNETLAPDVLAKQLGAEVENWEALKVVSGALVDGQRVGVLADVPIPDLSPYASKNVHLCQDLEGFDAGIGITPRVLPTSTPTIWLRPRVLVIGVGCNRGTPEEEIAREVLAVLAEHRLSPLSVLELATIELKMDEEGLLAFARARGWPLRPFNADQINGFDAPYERSETVFRHTGYHGVAEPAAMLAANTSRLLVPKQKRGNLTVAIAMAGEGP